MSGERIIATLAARDDRDTYHLTINLPATDGAREAIESVLDAADRIGILHDGLKSVDVHVEWDGPA